MDVLLTLAIHKHRYPGLSSFERNMKVNYAHGSDENWCDVHDRNNRNRVIAIVMKLLQVIILKTNKQR